MNENFAGETNAQEFANAPQNEILRYGRLKICATSAPCLSAPPWRIQNHER